MWGRWISTTFFRLFNIYPNIVGTQTVAARGFSPGYPCRVTYGDAIYMHIVHGDSPRSIRLRDLPATLLFFNLHIYVRARAHARVHYYIYNTTGVGLHPCPGILPGYMWASPTATQNVCVHRTQGFTLG